MRQRQLGDIAVLLRGDFLILPWPDELGGRAVAEELRNR